MVGAAASVSGGVGLAQGWDLLVALILSSFIGVERELRQKSAGLRTHTLVGLGAALFMLISKYGFQDVLRPGHVVVDPSRVAAQIVTGIGFIGGGLIFVRRDMVRGLTTAAAVWLTAAVGAAAGAGLLGLAAGVTAAHFLVVYGYTPIVARLPAGRAARQLLLRYRHGSGALRQAMEACTTAGFVIAELSVHKEATTAAPRLGEPPGVGHPPPPGPGDVEVAMRVEGKGDGRLAELVATLGEIDGVVWVVSADASSVGDSP